MWGWILSIAGLAFMWGTYMWDYTTTISGVTNGYFTEGNDRYVGKDGKFQRGQFVREKFIVPVVVTIITFLVLIFVKNEYYHLAPFAFLLITGGLHLRVAASNARLIRIAKEKRSKGL